MGTLVVLMMIFLIFFPMVETSNKHIHIQGFVSLYFDREMISTFQREIGLFSIGLKDDVISKPCFKGKWPILSSGLDGSPTPYLYSPLNIIHDLGQLIPFPPFNVAASQVTLGNSKLYVGGQKYFLLSGYSYLSMAYKLD